jgi:hypothetical protein
MSDDPAGNINGQITAASEKAPPNWLSRLLWMGPRVAEARATTFGPAKPGFVWFDIARQLSDDTPEIGETGKCSLAGILLDCEQVGLLVRAVLEREGLLPDADRVGSGGLSPPEPERGREWEPSQGSHLEDRVGSPPALPAAYHRGRVWEPSQGSHLEDRVGSPPALPAAYHRGREWEPSQGSHLNDWENALKLPVVAEAFARLTAPQRSMLTAMLGPDRDATLAKLIGEDRSSFARAVRGLVVSLSEPLAFDASRLWRALFARWSRVILVTLVLAAFFGVAASWLDKKFGKPNIALHCPVTVSSQYPSEGTDHRLLVDGDPDNMGFHTESNGQQWVVIDLGSIRKFDKVVVYNRSDGFQDRAVPLRLEVSSDNVHFTHLRERKETFDKWTARDLHAEGRYVRLLNAPPNAFHLSEVQIY